MDTTKTRLAYGVGINDADYATQRGARGSKRDICPFYARWDGMLKRCYSLKVQSRQPTYVDCKVYDEWHSFIAFKSWMQTQDWEDKELDKDLIGDGKLYSPETCVFVPKALNLLFTDREAKRGEHPIGVCWNKKTGKFQASIGVNGKSKYLGVFTNPTDAHKAWLEAKIEIAKGFLENETNPRIRYAIECGIAKIALCV